jgi:hypothetical protein
VTYISELYNRRLFQLTFYLGGLWTESIKYDRQMHFDCNVTYQLMSESCCFLLFLLLDLFTTNNDVIAADGNSSTPSCQWGCLFSPRLSGNDEPVRGKSFQACRHLLYFKPRGLTLGIHALVCTCRLYFIRGPLISRLTVIQ